MLIHSAIIQNMSSVVGAVVNCSLINATLNAGYNGIPFDLWMPIGGQFQSCIQSLYPDPMVVYPTKPFVANLGGGYRGVQVATTTGIIPEMQYLHGIMCAMMTKTGVVGFVTSSLDAKHFPGLVHSIAAFAVGVRTAEAEMNVTTASGKPISILVGASGSFTSLVPEEEATKILLSHGVDCIAAQENDLTVNYVAASANVLSTGYNSDARYFAGETVLSSALFVWEALLEPFLLRVANDTWIDDYSANINVNFLTLGYPDGGITLSGFSTRLKPEVSDFVQGKVAGLIAGTQAVYCLPYYNDSLIYESGMTTEVWNGKENVTCLNWNAWNFNLSAIPSGAKLVIDYSNPSADPYVTVYVYWSSPEAIVLILLCAGLTMAAIASGIDLIVHWNSPVYRASSPIFCLIILIGVIMACVAPILRIGTHNTTVSCMIPWWIIGLAYTAIFSCMLAKNWRVWRIFDSAHLKAVAILDTDLLFKFVGVLLFVELAILGFWTGFDPLTPRLVGGDNLAYNERQMNCQSLTGRSIGQGVFLSWNVMLLFPIAFISYRTRIAKEEYRENSAIALIVYANIVLIITYIGVLFSTPFDYLIHFYLTGYGVWIIFFIVYIALFLPKHYRLYVLSSSSTSSSGVQLSTLQTQQEHGFDSGFMSHSATQRNRDSIPNFSLVGSEVNTQDPVS